MANTRSTPLTRLVVLFFLALGLWLASVYLSSTLSSEWSTRGMIGDSFGAVNALFSGLGLAGIVYAILLQRDDLASQRLEISLARQGQSEAMEISREQASSLKLSVELSATSALLSYYMQEREIARSRSHHALADSLQEKMRRLSSLMELKIALGDVDGDI